jgi:DMSO reductase family type II enzyme heme b subunit
MFKKTLDLMAAPVAMVPGAYVPAAYADQLAAVTPQVSVTAERARGWRFELTWRCPAAVAKASELGAFPDACAVLTAESPDAQWITMGAPGVPVVGAMWRSDRPLPLHVKAEGLGTVVRGEPLADWRAEAAWKGGVWKVVLELGAWAPLDTSLRFAVAVWRGSERQRAGLKSVTQDWIVLPKS